MLLEVSRFKAITGPLALDLDRGVGLWYVTGKNAQRSALGANGVGKSTLLADAPYWCLTGTTIKSKRPGKKVETWVGSGTTKVRLTFLVDNVQHVIDRQRHPNHLLLDGHPVDQRTIDSLIGLDAETLRHTLIIGQFGTPFLSLGPEAQAQMIGDILNLWRWDDAMQRAKDKRKLAENALLSSNETVRGCKTSIELAKEQETSVGKLLKEWEYKHNSELEAADNAYKDAILVNDELKLNAPAETPKAMITRAQAKADEHAEALRASMAASEKAKETALNQRLASQAVTATEEKLKEYRKPAAVCPECGQEVGRAHIRKKLTELNAKLTVAKNDLTNATTFSVAATNAAHMAATKLDKLATELRVVQLEYEKVSEANIKYREDLGKSEAAVKMADAVLRALQVQNNPHMVHWQRAQENLLAAEHQLLKNEKLVQKYQREHDIADYWWNAFKEIRLAIIDQALTELALATTAHAEALGMGGRIEFLTEKENTSGSILPKFTVAIYPEGQDDTVDWESSGGEDQRWSLAATLGLSDMLLSRAGISTNIEVLDEPTTHLSAVGVDYLLEHLRTRATLLGRSIYFVDHNSLNKGEFQGMLVLEKDSTGTHLVE